MSYQDENRRTHGYDRFKNRLHLFSGTIYILVAAYVLYDQDFANLGLPKAGAYAFGGLAALYGIYRIWRGIAGLREEKENRRP